VRAAPGEVNVITVRRSPRGIVITDNVPLTGSCRPASTGGRFCKGEFDGVDVFLGDGDDVLLHSTAGGSVEGGPGDDDISVSNAIYLLTGGSGADRLDATDAMTATVSCADHREPVNVRLNGLPDDGAPGEGATRSDRSPVCAAGAGMTVSRRAPRRDPDSRGPPSQGAAHGGLRPDRARRPTAPERAAAERPDR
jgi:hypothetical protein